jgi:hypothetical protein
MLSLGASLRSPFRAVGGGDITCVGVSWVLISCRAFLNEEVGVLRRLTLVRGSKRAVEEAVWVVEGFGEDGNRQAGATGGNAALGFGEK